MVGSDAMSDYFNYLCLTILPAQTTELSFVLDAIMTCNIKFTMVYFAQKISADCDANMSAGFPVSIALVNALINC